LYANCVAGREGFFVAGVCDLDLTAATKLAIEIDTIQRALYGDAVPACVPAPSFEALSRALPKGRRRLAVNLSPAQFHYEINKTLLEAGCHVWSEKPLASSVAEAAALCQLAADKGLELGCSPVSFWGAAQQCVARQLAAAPPGGSGAVAGFDRGLGFLGAVRTVTADVLCGSWQPTADRLGGWRCHRRFGVGSLHDVGVYPLSLITALLGPAVAVQAVEPGETDGDCDLWSVQLFLASGAVATLTTSLSLSAAAADKAYAMTLRT
jgi:predicted dehydrogenase